MTDIQATKYVHMQMHLFNCMIRRKLVNDGLIKGADWESCLHLDSFVLNAERDLIQFVKENL